VLLTQIARHEVRSLAVRGKILAKISEEDGFYGVIWLLFLSGYDKIYCGQGSKTMRTQKDRIAQITPDTKRGALGKRLL